MIKCTFEDGGAGHLRHVTVDGIITNNNKILLVKRSHQVPVEAGKFSLPGGYLDHDESANEGIVREVLEETGFNSVVKELFLIIHSPRLKGDDRQNVDFIFTLNLLDKIQNPDREIESLHWFSYGKLPPTDQIGFDHTDIIDLFLKHQKNPKRLPYVNFIPL